jgi:hypothetical protein
MNFPSLQHMQHNPIWNYFIYSSVHLSGSVTSKEHPAVNTLYIIIFLPLNPSFESGSSKTSVNFYQTTRRHTQNDSSIHSPRHEKLKSVFLTYVVNTDPACRTYIADKSLVNIRVCSTSFHIWHPHVQCFMIHVCRKNRRGTILAAIMRNSTTKKCFIFPEDLSRNCISGPHTSQIRTKIVLMLLTVGIKCKLIFTKFNQQFQDILRYTHTRTHKHP